MTKDFHSVRVSAAANLFDLSGEVFVDDASESTLRDGATKDWK